MLEFIALTLIILIALCAVMIYDIINSKIKMWREKKLLDEIIKDAKRRGLNLWRFGDKLFCVNLTIDHARKRFNRLRYESPKLYELFWGVDHEPNRIE